MPIYEYECRRCNHRFELIQKFSDKPRKRCPECSGAVDRLISSAAIRFKGTGWYVTDYADKKRPDKEAERESGADPAKSDEKEPKKKTKEEKKAKETGSKAKKAS